MRKRKKEPLTILAIETSCDDTCMAILKIRNWKRRAKNWKLGIGNWKLEILSNIVSSQVKVHAKYGGVYPTLAKREHQRNIVPVLETALKKARNPEINLIAVTVGPGLEPCLWVGVNFARAISRELKLPIVPVNHIEAHILVNFQFPISNFQNIFPAVCLVVSGGHTQLILMKEIGKYKILGETRDDAAGECFDKVARILGLGYPGGPAIAAEAAKFSIFNSQFSIKLPRPMIHQKNYDFSFSGLKTAVLYDYKEKPPEIRESKNYIQEMAFEAQEAIIEVLVSKTIKAAKEYKVRTIILGGGVASNQELRKRMRKKAKELNCNFLVPKPQFCTDNAVMVGITAFFHWICGEKKDWKKIKVNANLKI